ncbi:Hypothetical predicted protein [Scomber scombrus]|uniref:Uncharacterized protein n=1 Tax=Scomber scombrus TaxID=13677 RepID=A0AAV1PPU4_SCOSC
MLSEGLGLSFLVSDPSGRPVVQRCSQQMSTLQQTLLLFVTSRQQLPLKRINLSLRPFEKAVIINTLYGDVWTLNDALSVSIQSTSSYSSSECSSSTIRLHSMQPESP